MLSMQDAVQRARDVSTRADDTKQDNEQVRLKKEILEEHSNHKPFDTKHEDWVCPV